jgi:hypothetical protein
MPHDFRQPQLYHLRIRHEIMDKFAIYSEMMDEHFVVRLFLAISIATIIVGALTLR